MVTAGMVREVYQRLFRQHSGWRGWRVLQTLYDGSPAGGESWTLTELRTAPSVLVPMVAAGVVHKTVEGRTAHYRISSLGKAVYELGCPCCEG